MHKSPCGFDVPSGHRGRLPDGSWMLFPTRREYEEYFQDALSEPSTTDHFQNLRIFDPLQRTELTAF